MDSRNPAWMRVAVRRAVVLLACVMVSSAAAAGQKKGQADNYDAALRRYLEEARKTAAAEPSAWMTSLAMDPRAMRVNDLITIRIVESITATGTADAALAKDSTGTVSLPTYFGAEKLIAKVLTPSDLANMKSSSSFKGSGTTTRASDLTATMGARVIEVLPNGNLVVEGIRQIEINGDTQMVVLTGVARVSDIDSQNMIASTQLGQLSVRYFGRGLTRDSLSPGLLVRILNKIF